MNIANMTLEEKIAQLFIITPEELIRSEEDIVQYNSAFDEAIETIPICGLLFFRRNLKSKVQIADLLNRTQSVSLAKSGLPLFQCIDEEGGRISKVLNSGIVSIDNSETPYDLGNKGNIDLVYDKGRMIGRCLCELGFTLDFAPVCDVRTNPDNKVIGDRAFSSSAYTVADMSVAFAKGLIAERVIPVLKHFPGHGDTNADSHYGCAYTNRNLEELMNCELIPFKNGIEERMPIIMMGHISLPTITGNSKPASLSKEIVTDLLRQRLGFNGLVITDSLKMKAISDNYSSSEASIKAIEAGNDIILRPIDFYDAYYGVIEAVRNGRLSESRIDESLRRIFMVKSSYMKLNNQCVID